MLESQSNEPDADGTSQPASEGSNDASGGSGEPSSDESELTNALTYAFTYLTLFFLALMLLTQVEPLVGFLFPITLLTVPITVLFIILSLQLRGSPEHSKKKIGSEPLKTSPLLFLGVISITLFFMLLFLWGNIQLIALIPIVVIMLFLEYHALSTSSS